MFSYADPGDEDDFFAPLLPPRDPLDPLLTGGAVPAASVCAASTLLLAAIAVSSVVTYSSVAFVVVGVVVVVVGYTAFGSATLLMPVNRRCKRLRSREVI